MAAATAAADSVEAGLEAATAEATAGVATAGAATAVGREVGGWGAEETAVGWAAAREAAGRVEGLVPLVSRVFGCEGGWPCVAWTQWMVRRGTGRRCPFR